MLVNHCAHAGAANSNTQTHFATHLDSSIHTYTGRPITLELDSIGVPSYAVALSCSCPVELAVRHAVMALVDSQA